MNTKSIALVILMVVLFAGCVLLWIGLLSLEQKNKELEYNTTKLAEVVKIIQDRQNTNVLPVINAIRQAADQSLAAQQKQQAIAAQQKAQKKTWFGK